MPESNGFEVGDKARWNGKHNSCFYPIGTEGVVLAASHGYVTVEVEEGVSPRTGTHFDWRWDIVPPTAETSASVEMSPPNEASQKKTGGSTPTQYRLSLNLPLTEDRNKYADVDLEAMDVIDALDLSGNLKDVQKALFRMGKKDGTSDAYDLNKCMFYILREMKKRGIISHAKFWQVSEGLTKLLED